VISLPLRARSYAKINLALSVLGRRQDGYHDIQTIFQNIDLYDEFEFHSSPHIELHCKSFPDIRQEDNLVWKAAASLASECGGDHTVSITLRKNIPLGAGLGGGSSNAAITLLALRCFWNLDISDSDLISIAADLGSDVPFFLRGGTALGIGRGEEIHPLPDPPTENMIIIYPGVTVSTAEAYRSLNLGLTSSLTDHRIQRLCGQIKAGKRFLAEIFNDFEASILSAYPPILEAKNFLKTQGAMASMLSGSGSSVFGFFSNEESALAAARKAAGANWQVFPAKTLSRAEYFQNILG
jgi:4-diphosphocytidyl-2-C-methyl-D-erythritol kinase